MKRGCASLPTLLYKRKETNINSASSRALALSQSHVFSLANFGKSLCLAEHTHGLGLRSSSTLLRKNVSSLLALFGENRVSVLPWEIKDYSFYICMAPHMSCQSWREVVSWFCALHGKNCVSPFVVSSRVFIFGTPCVARTASSWISVVSCYC